MASNGTVQQALTKEAECAEPGAKRSRLAASEAQAGELWHFDAGAFDKSLHVWFVRHAETQNNLLVRQLQADLPRDEAKRLYKQQRSIDSPLSVVGREQVRKLSRHPGIVQLLKPGRPVDLYSSPLVRAVETAAALQAALPSKPGIRLRGDLSELGGLRDSKGVQLPGKTRKELQDSFPDFALIVDDLPAEDGWWTGRAPEEPQAERLCAGCWARIESVTAWLRALRPSSPEVRDVVIVGHGKFMESLIPELLGNPRGRICAKHGNTSVTHLELSLSDRRVACVHAMNVEPTEVQVAEIRSGELIAT